MSASARSAKRVSKILLGFREVIQGMTGEQPCAGFGLVGVRAGLLVLIEVRLL